MPLESAVISTVVVAVFLVFAFTVAWVSRVHH